MNIKVLIFNLTLASLLSLGQTLPAQTVEKSRTVTQSFKTGPDTEIEVINKYGNIHLVTWEKDSVRFDIELMVKGTKQSKVDKAFDYVEFDFKNSDYYIIAQTLFAGKSSFWSDVSDLTGAIFNSSTKTKIDYTVYLPGDVSLKITNKYGNIYTTDHSGKVSINLSNGDLKAHHFSGNTKIVTEFGSADVKEIDDGHLDISYAEFYLEKGGRLTVNSKSSKFYLNNINEMDLNSKRDKFFVQNINNIHGTTNFTFLEIDQLRQRLDLETQYGDMNLKSFSNDVETVKFNSKDSDLTFHFTDAKQYNLDMTVDKDTEVYYSQEITNITTKKLGEDEKLIKVDCVVGSNGKLAIPFKINSYGGSISLKLK